MVRAGYLFIPRLREMVLPSVPVLLAVALMVMPVSLPALTISKKKQKREEMMRIKPDVDRLIQLAEDSLKLPPTIIADDQAAYDYCNGMAWRSEEKYAKDTAAVNAWYREMQWINQHQYVIPLKDRKFFPGYNQEKLDILFSLAEQKVAETSSRYALLRRYCDGVSEQQREARARTMPEGRVLYFDYEESGGSRPVDVFYRLYRDSLSGRVVLYGHDFETRSYEPLKINLDESVMDSVRLLIEKHQIYKELRSYTLPPSFPKAPLPCGGPPDWSFRCGLGGGSVQTRGNGVDVPDGCIEIKHYLSSKLQAWEKKQNLY